MDSVEVTALSGVHRCETSGAVNLGQPWHWKPSSSSDRRHNSLLPAATQFNDLWGTLSEATNAEKSILFQGRFGKHNFFFFSSVFKTPLVVENSIVWDEVKIVLFCFCIFFSLHFSSVCIVCCAPADHGCYTVVRCLCQGNDSRREWWKAAVIERSWATKIWSNIYIRAAFESPHSRLTIEFWAAGPMWRHKTRHTQHLKSVCGGDRTSIAVSNCNTVYTYSPHFLEKNSVWSNCWTTHTASVSPAPHWI